MVAPASVSAAASFAIPSAPTSTVSVTAASAALVTARDALFLATVCDEAFVFIELCHQVTKCIDDCYGVKEGIKGNDGKEVWGQGYCRS